MAWPGILTCFGRADRWFAGVTCTDGAGSPRSGVYADFADAQMQAVRRREQNLAADVGGYAAMVQLNHSSRVIRDGGNPAFGDDLDQLLRIVSPEVIYTHNPADKHDTHVAVTVAVLAALRRPAARAPFTAARSGAAWTGWAATRSSGWTSADATTSPRR